MILKSFVLCLGILVAFAGCKTPNNSQTLAEDGAKIGVEGDLCLMKGRNQVLCSVSGKKVVGFLATDDVKYVDRVQLGVKIFNSSQGFLDFVTPGGDCGVDVTLDFNGEHIELNQLFRGAQKFTAETAKRIFVAAKASETSAQKNSAIVMEGLKGSKCLENQQLKGFYVRSFRPKELLVFAHFNSSPDGYGGKFTPIGVDLANLVKKVSVKASLPKSLPSGSFAFDPKSSFLYFQNADWYRFAKADFARFKAQIERETNAKSSFVETPNALYFEGMIDGQVYMVEMNANGPISKIVPTFSFSELRTNDGVSRVDSLKAEKIMQEIPARVWVDHDFEGLYTSLTKILSSKDYDFVSANIIEQGRTRGLNHTDASSAQTTLTLPNGFLKDEARTSYILLGDDDDEISADIGQGQIELKSKNGVSKKLTWDGCHFTKMDEYQWLNATAPGVRGAHVGFLEQLKN